MTSLFGAVEGATEKPLLQTTAKKPENARRNEIFVEITMRAGYFRIGVEPRKNGSWLCWSAINNVDPMEKPEKLQLFTIGHSSHAMERFLGLLKQHAIEVVVDTRSGPYSRYVSQYNREELQVSLKLPGGKTSPRTWKIALGDDKKRGNASEASLFLVIFLCLF